MVGRRRDSKQRATPRRPQGDGSLNPQCAGTFVKDALGAPCNVWMGPCSNDNRPDSCCSNVMFLLKAACQTCIESDQFKTWDSYSVLERCGPTPSSDPPPSKSIPSWAIEMASATPTPDSFDFQAVLKIINGNSTGTSTTSGSLSSASTDAASSASSTASTTSISGSPSSSTSQPVDTPPSTPLPVSLASTTSTPVGAIVGGIIGALVFIALVGVGIWYMVRRRRAHHMAPSAAYKAAVRAGHQSPMPYQPVYHDSPRHSTEDLPEIQDGGAYPFLQTPSRPVSIHSESRFREHTTT